MMESFSWGDFAGLSRCYVFSVRWFGPGTGLRDAVKEAALLKMFQVGWVVFMDEEECVGSVSGSDPRSRQHRLSPPTPNSETATYTRSQIFFDRCKNPRVMLPICPASAAAKVTIRAVHLRIVKKTAERRTNTSHSNCTGQVCLLQLGRASCKYGRYTEPQREHVRFFQSLFVSDC